MTTAIQHKNHIPSHRAADITWHHHLSKELRSSSVIASSGKRDGDIKVKLPASGFQHTLNNHETIRVQYNVTWLITDDGFFLMIILDELYKKLRLAHRNRLDETSNVLFASDFVGLFEQFPRSWQPLFHVTLHIGMHYLLWLRSNLRGFYEGSVCTVMMESLKWSLWRKLYSPDNDRTIYTCSGAKDHKTCGECPGQLLDVQCIDEGGVAITMSFKDQSIAFTKIHINQYVSRLGICFRPWRAPYPIIQPCRANSSQATSELTSQPIFTSGEPISPGVFYVEVHVEGQIISLQVGNSVLSRFSVGNTTYIYVNHPERGNLKDRQNFTWNNWKVESATLGTADEVAAFLPQYRRALAPVLNEDCAALPIAELRKVGPWKPHFCHAMNMLLQCQGNGEYAVDNSPTRYQPCSILPGDRAVTMEARAGERTVRCEFSWDDVHLAFWQDPDRLLAILLQQYLSPVEV